MKSLWLSFLVACGGAVPRGEPPDRDVPWCVRFSYETDNEKLRVAQACVETERICLEVVTLLSKYGRLGNVEQVADCEEL